MPVVSFLSSRLEAFRAGRNRRKAAVARARVLARSGVERSPKKPLAAFFAYADPGRLSLPLGRNPDLVSLDVRLRMGGIRAREK